MAYAHIQGTATDGSAFFSDLKTFLTTTVGWTLHDDQTALPTPYFVVSSQGESGKEDIYLQFLFESSRVKIRAARYWDAVSHTGVNLAYHASLTYIRHPTNGSFLFWIYANLDRIFTVTKEGSTYYGQYSGCIKRFWSADHALLQDPVQSGSQIQLSLDDASILKAEHHYLIADHAHIERVRVLSVDTQANTVLIENLNHDYAMDSKIGEDLQPVIVSGYQAPGSFYGLTRFDGWASTSGQAGSMGVADGGFRNYTSPDMRADLITLFPWFVGATASSYQELRGELLDVYGVGSGTLDSEYIIEVGQHQYRVFNLSSAGWTAVREVVSG